MRAVLALALLLSVATPPGLWHATAEGASKGAATTGMSAPASVLCQLVRDTAKTDKTFSSGWFAAIVRAPTVLSPADSDHPIAHASPLHAIAIDCPPLAPRPPPAS